MISHHIHHETWDNWQFLPTFSGKSGSFEALINMWQLPRATDLDLVFLAGDEVTELRQVIFHGATGGTGSTHKRQVLWMVIW